MPQASLADAHPLALPARASVRRQMGEQKSEGLVNRLGFDKVIVVEDEDEGEEGDNNTDDGDIRDHPTHRWDVDRAAARISAAIDAAIQWYQTPPGIEPDVGTPIWALAASPPCWTT